jgi:enolase
LVHSLIGDEGGFAPSQIEGVGERMDLMLKVSANAGYGDMKIALDPAPD